MDIKKTYILWRSSLIQGWLMPKEPDVLYTLAKKYIGKNGLAAEVGSWKGRSTYILAQVCRTLGARLISIDTFAGPESETGWKDDPFYKPVKNKKSFFQENIEKNLKGLPVEYLKMTSHKALRYIKDRSLDFCFLDSDHTLPVVADDIKNYKSKVKKGGILLGHDYSPVDNPKNDVRPSVDKLLGRKNIEVQQSIWIYEI